METGNRQARPAILGVVGVLLFIVGWSAGRSSSLLSDTAGRESGAAVPAAKPVESGQKPTEGRTSLVSTHVSPAALTHQLMTVSEQDLVAVVEGLGKLSSLGDAAVREAHGRLASYPPRLDYVGTLTMGYLWHRMERAFPDTPFPSGWGLEYHREALVGAHSDPAEVEARLNAGENLDAFTRRSFFLGEIARDPVAALVKWRRFSDVEGNLEEVGWFGPAFAEEAQRARMMEALFPAGETVTTDTAYLLAALAGTWMQRDFAAVEAWSAGLPAQVQPIVAMSMLRHLAENDPVRALAWRVDNLGEAQRAPAVDLALARLATSHPDTAMRFLATVQDPTLQTQHLQTFSLYHALANYDNWNAWRESLPAAQADRAAVAGFETWLNRDPAAASRWLGEFTNAPERANLIALMASRLIQGEDKATVIGWVESLPEPSERTTAIAAAIRGCDPNDTETMRTLMRLAK